MFEFPVRVASIIARSIVSLLPERKWYAVAVRISGLLSPLFRRVIGVTRFRNDPRKEIIDSWLLNTILRFADTRETPFPIPIVARGTEALQEAWNHPHGVVICCIHQPLAYLIPRCLVELNYSPTAVVAAKAVVRDGMFHSWGSSSRRGAFFAMEALLPRLTSAWVLR